MSLRRSEEGDGDGGSTTHPAVPFIARRTGDGRAPGRAIVPRAQPAGSPERETETSGQPMGGAGVTSPAVIWCPGSGPRSGRSRTRSWLPVALACLRRHSRRLRHSNYSWASVAIGMPIPSQSHNHLPPRQLFPRALDRHAALRINVCSCVLLNFSLGLRWPETASTPPRTCPIAQYHCQHQTASPHAHRCVPAQCVQLPIRGPVSPHPSTSHLSTGTALSTPRAAQQLASPSVAPLSARRHHGG